VPCFSWRVTQAPESLLCLCAFLYEEEVAHVREMRVLAQPQALTAGKHMPLTGDSTSHYAVVSVRVFFVDLDALQTKTENCIISKML